MFGIDIYMIDMYYIHCIFRNQHQRLISCLPGVWLGHANPHGIVAHDETHAYFAREKSAVLLDTNVLAFFDCIDMVRVGGVSPNAMLFL